MIMDRNTFINAQQAKLVRLYKKNRKEKLLRNSAVIWLNKMCRLNHLTPTYSLIINNETFI